MRRWFFIGFVLIAFISMVGCKQTASQETTANQNDLGKTFQPYAEREVPQLKELIQQKGFKQYVIKQPYVLGYSYDGTYLAAIMYEKETDAYRIEIHHTGQNSTVDIAYAPAKKRETTDASVEEGAKEEQLQATQETLDIGFQIKVPAKQQWLPMNKKKQISENPRFLTASWDGSIYRLLGEDSLGNRWRLVEEVLDHKADRLNLKIQLVSHPQFPNRLTTIASTENPGSGLKPFLFTADTAKWSPAWSETKLHKGLKKWFPDGGTIVYRGGLGSGSPDSLLAVAGAKESPKRGAGLLYEGRVRQFVLLSSEQKEIFRGGADGLYYKENRVSSTTQKVEAYCLLLIINETSMKERMMVVDELDSSGDVIKTYELVWDVDYKQFRLIGENG